MKALICNLLTVLWMVVQPVVAQQIRMDDFHQVKKHSIKDLGLQKNKQFATLNLQTGEKGFTFTADGNVEIKPTEGDDKQTLLLPKQTRFLVIKHPDYGQLTWKIPIKLKKKKVYAGYLFTYSPDKEYQIGKQWAVLNIKPENAIVHIDSIYYPTRSGIVQVYLPLGKHMGKVESPFYETWEDTIYIEKEAKWVKQIELQPCYAYLTVRTPLADGTIYLNGQAIGKEQATSSKLIPGDYHLELVKDTACFYDRWIKINKSEKRTINLTEADLIKRRWNNQASANASTQWDAQLTPEKSDVSCPSAHIRLIAKDKDTEIWINRELKGHGEWEGELPLGFYAINTRYKEVESGMSFLWIKDSWPQTINLSAPQADYGWINISSNVVGAEIFVNNVSVGQTPCILQNLPANHEYVIRVKKAGFKEDTQTISLRGNDMTDLHFILKQKKR